MKAMPVIQVGTWEEVRVRRNVVFVGSWLTHGVRMFIDGRWQ